VIGSRDGIPADSLAMLPLVWAVVKSQDGWKSCESGDVLHYLDWVCVVVVCCLQALEFVDISCPTNTTWSPATGQLESVPINMLQLASCWLCDFGQEMSKNSNNCKPNAVNARSVPIQPRNTTPARQCILNQSCER
jgi:hypothetical protein